MDESYLARKEYEPGIELLRRRLVRKPADGRIVQRLMAALGKASDRASAMAVAEAHGSLLRLDFDAEPDAEVAALAEALRKGGERDHLPHIGVEIAIDPPPHHASPDTDKWTALITSAAKRLTRARDRHRGTRHADGC